MTFRFFQVSSNVGFKRAARMKMFDIPMVTHSARALTELKQIKPLWKVKKFIEFQLWIMCFCTNLYTK